MSHLKILTNSVKRTQFLAPQVNYSTAAIASTTASNSRLQDGLSHAKPLSECPKATIFELVRGFMPGGKYYKKDMNAFMRGLHEDKGDIVFLPPMLRKRSMVMTQNPDDFEIVFRNEGIWPERNGLELMTYHRNVLRKDYFGDNTGLVFNQGKTWGDLRTVVNPILVHPKNVKIYLSAMSKINMEFVERIKQIRDPKTLEVPDNFKEEINHWTLESVALVALNRRLGLIQGKNPDGMRLVNNLQKFFDLSVELEIKPSLWRYLPNRKLNKAVEAMDDLTKVTEKYISEAMEKIKNSPDNTPEDEKSVLEKLLKIDKKMAVVMAMDMMFGGVDTTTTTFTGLMVNLCKNPDKQEKLREEVLKILPNKDSRLTEESMKNLPYLRACFKENLRIYPLTFCNVRTINKDLTLSGYNIPKGTELLLVYLNLLQDERHYANPKAFIPERWLRQSDIEATSELSQCPNAARTDHPFIYLPFGFGARSCIGRRIAQMEVEIGVVRILRNFKVEFNYPVDNLFNGTLINQPAMPLKFKFTDLPY